MENKFFKRTLLGAAVALVASSASAAIPLAGDAVQLYGQAAGFIHSVNPDEGDSKVETVIESRIGFKGTVEFEDFAPNLIWQVETGDASNIGGNGDGTGSFGGRDTFLGLEFDGIGSFTYGRQLVAVYNYVDWPHSNPGLGNVFDWNNDISASYQDRANNTLRYDSATWGGFNIQATLSGMEETTDAMVISVAGSYTIGDLQVHGGVYVQDGYTKDNGEQQPTFHDDGTGNVVSGLEPGYERYTDKGDVSYSLIGATYTGIDRLTLTAGYKMMENDLTGDSQDAFSATGQYMITEKLLVKGGYAMTTDSDVSDTGDEAINVRMGYLLPSTYLYIDSRNYQMNNADGWDHNVLVGAEYYF